MGFSPIRSFRKHTKYWMAGLILVSMVTFVLCTGARDFGTWLLGLFSRSPGEPVAEINGKKVSDREMAEVRQRRKLADDFMAAAFAQALSKEYKSLLGQFGKFHKSLVENAIQRAAGDLSELDRQLTLLREQLKSTADSGKLIAHLPKIRENYRDQIIGLLKNKGFKFFAGSDSDEGLFEFLLWRAEADRLGIQLTDDAVKEEFKKATRDNLSYDDATEIQQGLLRNTQARPEWILDGLKDEFRVRLAQTWHLGYRPGVFSEPAVAVTPDQFWQFYQRERSEMRVDVLPVDADSKYFLKQVKDPSTAELKKFFDTYKGELKDPASPNAGLKKPARIQLEVIRADPETPYYKTMALVSLFASRASAPEVWLSRLLDEYENRKDNPKYNYELPRLGEIPDVMKAMPYYLCKPEERTGKGPEKAVVTLVGQILATGATQGHTWGFPSAYALTASAPGLAFVREYNERALFYASLSQGLASVAQWEDADRKDYLPLEIVQDQIVAEILKKAAADKAQADIEALVNELEKYKPRPLETRRPWVQKILTDAFAKYSLKFQNLEELCSGWEAVNDFFLDSSGLVKVTTGLLDEYQIARSGKLAPLKAAFLSQYQEKDKVRMAREFPREFFKRKDDLFNPQQLIERKATANWWETGNEKRYLYVKIQEEPSVVPTSLAEVRDEAIRQWKLKKARDLARAEAKAIAADLAKQKSEDDRDRKLKDYALKLGQELKTLDPVAPIIKPGPAPRDPRLPPWMPQPPQKPYKKYKIPEDLFEYPRTEEWTKKVLKMEKPGEEVQILKNQPELIFYVAAQVSKPEASFYYFRLVYAQDPNQGEDPLRALCLRDFAHKHKVEVINYLKEKSKFKDLRTTKNKEKDTDSERVDVEDVFGIQ
jgi:hypothetical protein